MCTQVIQNVFVYATNNDISTMMCLRMAENGVVHEAGPTTQDDENGRTCVYSNTDPNQHR